MQQEKQTFKLNSKFQQVGQLSQKEVTPVQVPIRKPIVLLGSLIGVLLSYFNTFIAGQLMLTTVILFGAVMIFRQIGSHSIAKGLPLGMMFGGALALLFFVGLIAYQIITGGSINTEQVITDMGKATWAIIVGWLIKRVFVK